jgi:hypothetical protein
MVIQLRGVEGVRDRIGVFLKSALPEIAPAYEGLMERWLKDGFDGRKPRGLAKDGPHFLVFTEIPKPGKEVHKVALILAVTNYGEFRDNILKENERKTLRKEEGYETAVMDGQTIYLIDRKDYAIQTPDKATAIAFTKKQVGLDTRLSKEQAAKFLAGDVSLYVSMDTLNKEYGDQIKQARDFVDQIVKTATEGEKASSSEKAVLALGAKVIGAGFQAVEDSQGLLASVEFRPSALAFHVQSELRAGSDTGKALADSRPAPLGDLAMMPAGQMVYTALKPGPTLLRALGGLTFGVFASAEGDEGKGVREAVQELLKAGPGTWLYGIRLPLSGLQVWTCADPTAAVAAQLKLIQALRPGDGFDAAPLKEKAKVTPRAEKHGDFELHRADLTWDLEKMLTGLNPNTPEEARKKLVEGMQKVFGEKTSVWFGTDGKVLVRVTAQEWPAARKLLDGYFKSKGTLGEADAYRAARKELPTEATLVSLIDLVPYATAVLETVKAQLAAGLPLPPGFPAAPPRGEPGFVGACLSLTADRASLDFVITATAVNQAFKSFVVPLRGG